MHQPHHHHHQSPLHPGRHQTMRPVARTDHTVSVHRQPRQALQWSAHHYKLWSAVFIGTVVVVSLWVWNFQRTVSGEKFAQEPTSGKELSEFRTQTASIIESFKQNMAQFKRLAQQARQSAPELSSTSAQMLTDKQIKELAQRVQEQANNKEASSSSEALGRLESE